ncbi:MAG TPA: cytochrome c-type biogenesis protein CcmH, partial [Polyangiales bacterium]|nr:cytochrome c-type biogenesis protein CcmH [Polyangiales bacterium]
MSVHENGAQRTVPRRALVFVAGAALATVATSAAADASASARELEGRLIAPCCWTQTLDIHDSPIADQLRTEIATRLRAGEPAAKIEDDLAARYGEKIRAVPRGEDPRVALPIVVGAAMSVAVLWLGWLG